MKAIVDAAWLDVLSELTHEETRAALMLIDAYLYGSASIRARHPISAEGLADASGVTVDVALATMDAIARHGLTPASFVPVASVRSPRAGRRSPPRRSRGSFDTYIVRRGPSGPVKIGKAIDIDRRITELQTANAEPLEIVRRIKGDVEAALHGHLRGFKIRGEWFSWSDEIAAIVDAFLRRRSECAG